MKIGDRVKLVKSYCADSKYVGLWGKVIEIVTTKSKIGKHKFIRVRFEGAETYPYGDTLLFPHNYEGILKQSKREENGIERRSNS